MRGLIYKDFHLFFKSLDKKLVLFACVVIPLFLLKAGVYAGLMASIILAMTISTQSIMSFASDEKSDWKKYQLTMPINEYQVVASKYISVICTLGISVLASILFSLISSIIYAHFDVALLGLSILGTIIVSLIWMGICLPLTYWFGFRLAQTIGIVNVIPIFYMIKFFEDGPGFSSMTSSTYSYLFIACVAAIVIFTASFIISIIGYSWKK